MKELEAASPDAAILWDERELSAKSGIAVSTLQKQRLTSASRAASRKTTEANMIDGENDLPPYGKGGSAAG